MLAIILAVWRIYHGVPQFVLPTDMAHGSGARPKVKEEEGSYGYALAEGLAAEFERPLEGDREAHGLRGGYERQEPPTDQRI